MKKIIAVLLTFIMILSMAGCKKEAQKPQNSDVQKQAEKAADPTVTPTPTPVPVTTEELFHSAMKDVEPVTKMLFTRDEKASADIKLPDGIYGMDLNLDLSYDLFGFLTGSATGTARGDVTSRDNVAKGKLTADSATKSTSAFSSKAEPEAQKTTKTTEFYVDATNSSDIISYYKEDLNGEEGTWYVDHTTPEELKEKLSQSGASAEAPETKESDLFKDLEEFFKSHTNRNDSLGGYETLTEFTWEEFYTHYSADFDSLFDEFGGALSDSPISGLTGQADQADIKRFAREMLGSGTGNFKCNIQYNTDKQVVGFNLIISDFAINYNMQYEGSSMPISFTLSKLDLKTTIERNGVPSVSVPGDVISKAVEPVVYDDTWSDTDWDDSGDGSEGSINWDDSDWNSIDWEDSDWNTIDWEDSDWNTIDWDDVITEDSGNAQ
ncbi:MAG: hypothetical protein K6G81_12060 [Lachnospiraceae bacterium]|nr:hypothetical protein [Lachnospiraceae bacterium]